jgi:hypothetical protein
MSGKRLPILFLTEMIMTSKNTTPIGFLADTALRRGLDRPQSSFSELEKTFSFAPEQIQKLRELMKCLNLSEKTILNMAIVYGLKFDTKEGTLAGRMIITICTKPERGALPGKTIQRLEWPAQGANVIMEEITGEITLATKNLLEAKQMQSFYNELAASGLARLHANLSIDQIKDIA